MRAYIAYYGRPADAGGLTYWAERLIAEGGSLSSIIQSFGTSEEFVNRYGSLSSTDLVSGIYRQLFGRDPDAGGLAYYTGELSAGRRSLPSIALDVLFGAQNADATIVENRLTSSTHFTSRAKSNSIDATRFDAEAMVAILASVGATPPDRACDHYSALLDTVDDTYPNRLDVTKTADTNDGVCDADCSLREAVVAANAKVGRTLITLPSGIYTLTHSEGDLFVTGNIHLRGTNPNTGSTLSTIDGGGLYRHFWLEASTARLTLSNLTLQNGKDSFGGSILSKGTLTLDRTTLKNNAALNNGGAVLNTNTFYSFSSKFSANTAAMASPGIGFGGAIFSESGTAYLFANSFDANLATHSGGGIYTSGALLAANTTFTGNTVTSNGGAIYTATPNGRLVLIGNRLSGNTANDGGALSFNEQGSATITTTTFDANIANGVDLGGGGAIFSYNGAISLADTVFTANLADGEGGGAIQNRGTLNISNSRFESNQARMHNTPLPSSADGLGGALLIIDGSLVTVANTTFSANVAGNSGGAIYNDMNTSFSLTGSTLSNNRAQGLFKYGAGGFGGAIHNEGGLTINGSTHSTNQAKNAGGAISNNQVAVLDISASSITGNTAANGGGIAVYGGTFALTDSTVSNNKASNSSNTAFGGGLLNDGSASTTLLRSTLQSNSADIGGGFSNNSATSTVRVYETNISGNTAAVDGAAFVNFGRVEVRGSTISGTCNNHATVISQGGNSIDCNW